MNKCLCINPISSNHKIHFKGYIRNGINKSKKNASVLLCKKCHIIFLEKKSQLNQKDYFNSNYRKLIIHGKTINGYKKRWSKHNDLYFKELNISYGKNYNIADVGCGIGLFLSKFKKKTTTTIAIEPNIVFHEYLKNKFDYKYNYLHELKSEKKINIDLLFCFHVIEHVEDPLTFINEIYDVLKKGGTAYIITPNNNEILNKTIPNFKQFYYRTVHNWYFDKDSISNLLNKSKFKKFNVTSNHFRGIDNYLYWVKHGKPYLKHEMLISNNKMDQNWKKFLEENYMGENIMIKVTK